MRSFPRSLFIDSAEILSGHYVDKHSSAACFLRDIGYLDEPAANDLDPSLDVRIDLLRIAAKMELFALEVPDAPRMVFIGGRVLPDAFTGYKGFQSSSASGISPKLRTAFESCVGEAIEYLSQLTPQHDITKDDNNNIDRTGDNSFSEDHWLCYHAMKKQNASEKKWLLGKNLLTNEDRWVPEVLCLRQKASLNTRGLSTGCAAGVSLDAAITSAIFELVERDAASLWWEGGRPPRPVSNEALVDAEIETVFKLAGRTGNKKTTLILDITTDIDIPCIAAISTDAKSGGRFSCGLSCRVSLTQAIRKAVYEMMQMELSHHLIAIKSRLHGVEALNNQEKVQQNRDESLGDIWDSPLIRTTGRPRLADDVMTAPSTELQKALEQLTQVGFDATMVDLSREDFGIPVAKVLIPELQTYPLVSTTTRLANMIADTGGGGQYTGGVSLL